MHVLISHDCRSLAIASWRSFGLGASTRHNSCLACYQTLHTRPLPLRRAALANRQGATCKRPEHAIVRPAIGLHCLARAMWHLALLAVALVGRVRSAIQDAQEDGCPDPGTEKVSREHGLLAHPRALPQNSETARASVRKCPPLRPCCMLPVVSAQKQKW